MELAQGTIGSETYDLQIVTGPSAALQVSLSGKIGPVQNSNTFALPLKDVLEALKKAVPNVFVDEVISAAEAGLGLV